MTPESQLNPPHESDVLKTYKEYLRASFSLDAKLVATYYDEQYMLVTAARTVTAATRADAEALLSPLFKDLKLAGYAKTEFPELKSHSLGDGLAVICGRGIRLTEDGREMGTFGTTYIWRNGPEGWKLAVMTVHDPKRLLPLN